jgi:hypothetical protein
VSALFETRRFQITDFDYDVTPDAERFLLNVVAADAQAPIHLLLNWTLELADR